MKKILFATGNPSKAKRFYEGLKKNGIELITLEDIDTEIEVNEDGKNAIENAILKAKAYSKVVDIPVFAMDDNLYLENVPEEKQPGMYVRRVNGKRLSDEEMIEYYSNLAKEYGTDGKLTCRWVYGMAVIKNGKESTYTWSKEDFYIVDKPSDKINPGYPLNTISINKKLNKYFTDITEEDKVLIHEDESDVVNFIVNSVSDNEKIITYVTGNWAKIDSAKQVLEPIGYKVNNIKMETPEIQANDVTDVAKYSAKWACEKLNKPVLKNDSGLFVEALKGFPGVYTHYADDTIGEDGLLKLMEGIQNRKAFFKESLAYCEPGKEPVVFEGITKGRIDVKKSGTYGWSWDFIFIPEGEEKTLGCFPDKERWKYWSLDSYKKLVQYLENK